jgi:MFS family permease
MLTTVLRHREFRRLWVATTIDAFGSWLLVMAVPLQVFALTGSAMSTGLALAVQAVPAVMIGPWAGVAIDRWPRKNILVTANLASAAGVALMLLATAPGRAGYLFVGLFAESVASCFLRPALRAVTPSVVPDEHDLASANALAAFSGSALRMAGPLIGTFLVTRGWFEAVVLLDAASYAVAAAIITGITIKATGARPARTPHVRRELREGVREVLGAPLLRGLLSTSWVYWTGNAALTALLVPFTAVRLHGSGQALGYVIAGLGVGYLAGSAIARPVLLRYRVRTILVVAYTSVGLCFVVLVNATALPVAVAAVTAAGVPGVVAQIAIGHRLQTAAPDAVLGRVAATFYTSDAVAAVTGALIAAVAITMVPLAAVLNAVSALVLLTGPTAAVLLPRIEPQPNQPQSTARH